MTFMQRQEPQIQGAQQVEQESTGPPQASPDVLDAYLKNSAMPDLPEDMLCVDSTSIAFPPCVTRWENWF